MTDFKVETEDYTDYTDGEVLDIVYECVFGDDASNRYSVNELTVRLHEMYDAEQKLNEIIVISSFSRGE
jgi:hypothetical protein